MAEPAIRAEGLGHAYRPGQWLFRGLDLSIAGGSSLAILAPNGRGKSTLLAALAGTLRPVEGRVNRSADVAAVPSGLVTEFDYTVLDIVLMGRARNISLLAGPSRHDEDAAVSALDRFGLSPFALRSYASLSSGERQLVLLARAIVSDAKTLLLDEPTAFLDLHHQNEVAGWIRRLNREGLTTIYTTHDPNFGMLAENALLLFGGGDYVLGPSHACLDAKTLQKLFGCQVLGLHSEDLEFSGRTFFVLPPHK